MKQTDTRQKDAIQSRAQKGHLLSFRDKSHVHSDETHGSKTSVKKDDSKSEKKVPVVSEIHHTKIGRNDSCPCGSGKKYKKCCLDKLEK